MNPNPAGPPRNPWPIAIVLYFIVFISFLVAFVTWAVRQREDLVSADYYEREVRYQEQLDSLNRALPFAATSVVTFDAARRDIIITLPDAQARGATGRIHLYRPSDARLDRELPLALNADGVQRVDAKELREGLWKVRVKWRIGGEDFLLDQPVIVAAG